MLEILVIHGLEEQNSLSARDGSRLFSIPAPERRFVLAILCPNGKTIETSTNSLGFFTILYPDWSTPSPIGVRRSPALWSRSQSPVLKPGMGNQHTAHLLTRRHDLLHLILALLISVLLFVRGTLRSQNLKLRLPRLAFASSVVLLRRARQVQRFLLVICLLALVRLFLRPLGLLGLPCVELGLGDDV